MSAGAGEIAATQVAAAVVIAADTPAKVVGVRGAVKVAGAPAAAAGRVGQEGQEWAVGAPVALVALVVGMANGGRDLDGSAGVTPPAAAVRVRAEGAAGSTRMRAIAAAVDHPVDHPWEVASGPASGSAAAACGTRVRRAKENATGGDHKSLGRETKDWRRNRGNLDRAATMGTEIPEWAIEIPGWVTGPPGQETESLDRETEIPERETEHPDPETATRETATRAPATPEQAGVIRADRSILSPAPASCPTTSRGIRSATGSSSMTFPR